MSLGNAAMLVPIYSASENKGERSTLSLQIPNDALSNKSLLFLGRGGTTGITEPRMSRKIAKIHWIWLDAKPALMIEPVSGQGTVQINSTPLQSEPIALLHGDVVSLISPDKSNAYDYRVNVPARLDQSDSQSTHQSVAKSGQKRKLPNNVDASEEFACSICLDIMVNPVTAVPCGHAFCGACLSANVRECPNCRAGLSTKPVPSRPLGQAIALLVECQPDLFDPDDVEQYRARKNAGQPLHPKPPSRAGKRTKFMAPAPANSAGSSAASAIVID